MITIEYGLTLATYGLLQAKDIHQKKPQLGHKDTIADATIIRRIQRMLIKKTIIPPRSEELQRLFLINNSKGVDCWSL